MSLSFSQGQLNYLMPFSIVNCLAENRTPLAKALADYLEDTLGLKFSLIQDDYPIRRQQLFEGQPSLGFMCGLLYTMFKDQKAPLEPLVAPISLSLGLATPSYLSYLIVKQNIYRQFGDLKNSILCINEEESFSGCQIIRYHLAKQGQSGFFSNVIQSGSHLQSIERVLAGDADTAAIDHTLFEYWARQNPKAATALQIIERLGPFPMPPLVISQKIPKETKQHLRQALLEMPQSLLREFDVKEFQRVDDQTYDPIRQAAKVGAKARLA